MSDKLSKDKAAGCAAACISLFITCPLVGSWLVLMFRVLTAIEAGTFEWVLYWIYVPSCVLGIIAASLSRLLGDD